jgi:zinc protease
LKAISEGANSPSKIADRMVLSRLLGTFPYARSANGEIESLPKIDRIDLQFARERLLKADNATVTIVGGVPDSKMLRSLRQKLGSWIKSDKPISQAFSQPDPPVAKTLIFDTGANENAEIRLAVRGVARSDNNYAAAMILSMIANERIRSSLSESANTKHIAHVLPGVFILSASVPNDKASQSIATAKQILNELATKEPNTNEFEKAKSSFLKFFSQQISNTKTLADFYLDRDTFKIQATPQAALKAIEALKPSDVQRVATRLFGNSSFAIVAVGNLSQLKDELSRNGNAIEIFGEKPVPQPTPKDDKKNPTQTLVLKPVGKP